MRQYYTKRYKNGWCLKLVVHNIWIFTKKSGTSLYHKKYGSVEVDESLFSGFLSSINTLAESEFDQKGVESIKMGNYKFLYEHFSGVLFTIAADPEDSDEELKAILVKARKKFFEQFAAAPWENYLRELAKSGQVEHFNAFQETLDEVLDEYKRSKMKEQENKKELLEIYNILINKFFLKVVAFSDVLDEDFATPMSNVVNDLVKNNEILKNIKVNLNGVSFDNIDIEKIKFEELRSSLFEILDGLITKGYNLMGPKPVNKIIGQLNNTIAIKLEEVQKLGICYNILSILLKSGS
ncbi:MAG: hypothetical protein ACTSR3_13010 [Candidatus Helarchaeota archaeon]